MAYAITVAAKIRPPICRLSVHIRRASYMTSRGCEVIQINICMAHSLRPDRNWGKDTVTQLSCRCLQPPDLLSEQAGHAMFGQVHLGQIHAQRPAHFPRRLLKDDVHTLALSLTQD